MKRSPRVAWVFAARGVRNIWVADAPSFNARQVTHYSADDGMPLASVRLTPDGRTVVYVRGSETNRKDEVADPTSNVIHPHQQVWAVDVDKGEPRLLGAMECNEEGCEDVQLSPDGARAVAGQQGLTRLAQGIRAVVGDAGGQRLDRRRYPLAMAHHRAAGAGRGKGPRSSRQG